jgi:beta-glucosidase
MTSIRVTTMTLMVVLIVMIGVHPAPRAGERAGKPQEDAVFIDQPDDP